MVKSKRISFLASLTQGYTTALDIGCDHGYVLKEALDYGYIKYAIASDLREMPLQNAIETLRNYPIKAILSDGFLAINEPFDVAIIAGMGAHLIKDIMKHAPLGDMTYIIQPNDRHSYLRKHLMEMGFMIVDEHAIYDRFFYLVMIVKRGNMVLSEEDLILGPILKHKKEAKPYYEHVLKRLDNIMIQADEKRVKELSHSYAIITNHLKR